MKNVVYIFGILLFSIACRQNKGIVRIKKEGLVFEGKITNDSILHGIVSIFDVKDQLLAKSNFLNNERDGLTTTFYLNGEKKEEIIYERGKKNGNYTVFDSLGRLLYRDYYYYGLQVGPVYFFNKDGSIKEYYFVNFEGETLFYYSYDKIKMQNIDVTDYFQMHVSHALQNQSGKLELFLYLINPPKFSFEYKVCIKDQISKDIKPIIDIPSRNVFYHDFLPYLDSNQNYCISLTVYDSLSRSKQTLIREIDIEK